MYIGSEVSSSSSDEEEEAITHPFTLKERTGIIMNIPVDSHALHYYPHLLAECYESAGEDITATRTGGGTIAHRLSCVIRRAAQSEEYGICELSLPYSSIVGTDWTRRNGNR